jgi:hypothetical protein
MAKVTVHHEPETPTKAAVKSANQLIYVTDARGRKIGLRRLPFLEEVRIADTVGAARAANQAYMGMVNPLLYIAEIDGDHISTPRTLMQVEALIQRADHEGFIAAALGIKEHFSESNPELEKQIKNLVGTQDSETVSGS